MTEPSHIKPKKLIFYFEEYLEFKGIHKSINLYKIYTNIKSVLSEIHSGYIVLGGAISLFGIGYSYFQSSGNNKDNNFNGIDIMKIDKEKIKFKNGKNMSIGYGMTNKNKIDLNDPFTIVSALASRLVGFMQLTIILILNLKVKVICRECNNIDTSSGYPEHELMDHYNISHKNLMGR